MCWWWANGWLHLLVKLTAKVAKQCFHFLLGGNFAPSNSASLRVAVFGKSSSFVTIGVVPFVKAKGCDVLAVTTIYKGCLAVVPPWSCKVDAFVANAIFAGKVAVVENKANCLLLCVRRRYHKTAFSTVVAVDDVAVFKQGVATTKNKVHRAFQGAVAKNLLARFLLAQFVFQKTIVSFNQVVG